MIEIPKINQSDILEALTRISNCHKCIILLDIDETLLNPLEKYKERMNKELNVSISVKDIEVSGGLDNLFSNTPEYDKFCLIADKLRTDNEFNSNLPRIKGSLEGVKSINEYPKACIAGYLTTRPLNVKKISIIDLQKNRYPNVHVISRPDTISRANTTDWKLSILNEISDQTSQYVIMIDDSLELSKSILYRNNSNNKPIISILFNGPLTYSKVERENIETMKDKHFYIATWDQIPRICYSYAQN